MLSLGVYSGGHDLGACLVKDGEIAAVIEEERLNRVKYGVRRSLEGLWEDFGGRFGYFPWASVAYCLAKCGAGLDDIDAIVLPDYDLAPLASLNLPVRNPERIIIADQPKGGAHHYVHALSAFFASPFDRAAVLVMDGDGTWTSEGFEAETGYIFDRSGENTEIFKNRYAPWRSEADPKVLLNPGLGYMYEYISRLLGFWNKRAGLPDAGKTMGLSAYGGPSEALREDWIALDGHRIDFSPFREWLRDSALEALLTAGDVSLITNENTVGRPARELAWKAQAELERGVLALCRWLHAQTGEKNLCLAGGVALNSVANDRICRETAFEKVFIQPAAGDNGQSIGLAYEGHLRLGHASRLRPIGHAFGGMSYPEEEVGKYLDLLGLHYERLRDDVLPHDAAAELSKGNIVGWLQGGSEYGPRALGHRSVLADPRPVGMKDKINHDVKFREPFRPFAPSVLADHASEVFDIEPGADLRFMLCCVPVRPEWQGRVPAVCHVDLTGRLQVVSEAAEPLFYALIKRFAELTGVPLVLNTSLNLRGMPLVETPSDAIACFVSTELSALYIGPFKVSPPCPGELCVGIADGWTIRYDPAAAHPVLSADATRQLALDDAEADVLRRCDLATPIAAAARQAGWDPYDQETGTRLMALARRGLRKQALIGRIGDLPLHTRWTYGRLEMSRGARRYGEQIIANN
jgi:carbamoyltransferase